MELCAAIYALEKITNSSNIKLFTDSKYLKDGITLWINNWKKNSWQSKTKKPIKNIDLWKKLDNLDNLHKVEWLWVRGHSGDPGNEKADMLARKAIQKKVIY